MCLTFIFVFQANFGITSDKVRNKSFIFHSNLIFGHFGKGSEGILDRKYPWNRAEIILLEICIIKFRKKSSWKRMMVELEKENLDKTS